MGERDAVGSVAVGVYSSVRAERVLYYNNNNNNNNHLTICPGKPG